MLKNEVWAQNQPCESWMSCNKGELGKQNLSSRFRVWKDASQREQPFLLRAASLVQKVENASDDASRQNCASQKILRDGDANDSQDNDPNCDDESGNFRIHP